MSLIELTFSDSLESSTAPTQGTLEASKLKVFASDAAFVSDKGSAAAAGDAYINSTDNTVKAYVSGNWRTVATIDGSQDITNKDIDGGTASDDARITLPKNTKTNLDGLSRKEATLVYATDDQTVYVDNGSSLSAVGGSSGGVGGGGAVIWRLTTNSPLEDNVNGLEVLDFDDTSSQQIFATIQVPTNYNPGDQILLKGMAFATSATSGDVLFQATTTLIEPGSSVLGSLSNTHDSTNSEVTVSATTNEITSVGDVDLCDSSGQINAVALAAGDTLLVKIIRDNSNETSSAVADARLLRNAVEVKFDA